MKQLGMILIVVLSIACSPSRQAPEQGIIDAAIADYRTQSEFVNIGDAKSKVLALLSPSQATLPAHLIRPPQRSLDPNMIATSFVFSHMAERVFTHG